VDVIGPLQHRMEHVVKNYNMEIKLELPELQEDKTIIERLDLLKLVLPNMANNMNELDFLKDTLYGSKEV
jgi:hypothetical protein